jgi:hypothetical protein
MSSPVFVAALESDKKYPIPISTWAGAAGFLLQGLGVAFLLLQKLRGK